MHITVGILAHVDAGKTTFSEQVLYHTGVIRRRGRVDHADSFFDLNPIEQRRGITVFSDQAYFPLNGDTIHWLDTPGHVDFSAEMERSARAMDVAVLLLSAAAKMGALVLPLRRAALVGALAALLLAGIVAAMGDRALVSTSGIYLALLLLLELALWRFGGRPDPARLRFVVELRLADSVGGALALGALCACMSTALSAGVAVRMAGSRVSPCGVGLLCALLYLPVLLAGNAALQRQQREILSLRTPFAALTALWGKPGFYLSAGLIFLGAVSALAGILRALMPVKDVRRDFHGC